MEENLISAYAVSMDPITFGHISVAETAASFSQVLYVLISDNVSKKYMFSTQERYEMVKEALSHLPNVKVVMSSNRYAILHAKELGAKIFIRGMRNSIDLAEEQVMAEENRNICPEVNTIWIPSKPKLQHISSTLVKSHLGLPGWEKHVARSVPETSLEAIHKKISINKAIKHWELLMKEFSKIKESDKIFKNLVNKYGAPERGHHTLEHVVFMLDELEEIKNQIYAQDYKAIRTAIWWHDENQDIKNKFNIKLPSCEAISARNCELDLIEFNLPLNFIKPVKKLIMATEHRNKPYGHNSQIITDLDIAIFGTDEYYFNRYEKGIRHEYNWVPINRYCEKRIEILKKFLDRPHIYYTEHFRNKYEVTARKNLETSIHNLELQMAQYSM